MMKKWISLILVLVLIAAAVYSAVRAGEKNAPAQNASAEVSATTDEAPASEPVSTEAPEAGIVGDWTGKWDLTDSFTAGFSRGGVNFTSEARLQTDLHFRFRSDGSYELRFDAEQLKTAAKQYFDDIHDEFTDFVYMLAEASGTSREEFEQKLENQGFTVDAYADSLLNPRQFDNLTQEQLTKRGAYRFDGDKLRFADSEDGLDDSEKYFTCTMTGDALTLTGVSDAMKQSGDAMVSSLFPVTLNRD